LADNDEVGFEFEGEFYPLTVNTDNGKDLMLIDRLTAMPTEDFLEAIRDGIGIGRGPIMLAMLATSIRAKHNDWSVERIYRITTADLSSVKILGVEEEDANPPAEAASETAATGESSTSSSEDSSPSQTRPESMSSPTLSVAQG
jgi:hypothetical protein